MKTKKLLVTDNEIMAEILRKKDTTKLTNLEEAIFTLWYEFHGYEKLAIEAAIELKELADELEQANLAYMEELGH